MKQILSETIADYEKRTGKRLQPAHIEQSIIQSYAYREQLVRAGINYAFLQQFPQFATGLALDLCGEPMGCYRLSNQSAEVTLRFSVEGDHDAVVIPEGTLVAATDNIVFATDTEVRIGSTESYVDVVGICQTTGTVGNGWQVGQVKTLKSTLDAKVTVSNIDVSDNGIDTESDDDYRKRILLAPEAFTTCGSVAAYEYHTRSVSQYISDVAISTPVGGTVKVTVLTKQGLPSNILLSKVANTISGEKRRPLCDTVIVTSPDRVAYHVVAELTLLENSVENDVRKKRKRLCAVIFQHENKNSGKTLCHWILKPR
ncbi:Uncharacterized homolog of phage Mu protein gp47 [Actinobacillus equuli]|nr:Uncharacterized homolog of phage Mu protein gp47 [Actinobacillus equuli]